MNRLTLDYETRSRAELKDVGAYMYSIDPSTEVMCVGWADEQGHSGQWNLYDADPPHELFKLMRQCEMSEAHNAFFEYVIYTNICVKRMGWPEFPVSKWRCSAAKAAAASLPRDLASGGRVLGLSTVKDEDGKKSMLKLSHPAKPSKAEPHRIWHSNADDWNTMLAYNMTDVYAEKALSAALPDLSPKEQRVWEMSERMNRRGFAVDTYGAESAVLLATEYVAKLNLELEQLTKGAVKTAGQRAKILVWLQDHNCMVEDTTAPVLDAAIAQGTFFATEECLRVMEIVRIVGRISIKKYQKMLDMAAPDGRVRGLFLYHGAGPGRWCLPGDAEVLTPAGWQSFDEWKGGIIAQWQEDNQIKFQFARKVQFKHTGDMIRLTGPRSELLCTPEHKIPTRVMLSKNVHPVLATDMKPNGKREVPLAGYYTARVTQPVIQTRVIVMFQADGSIIYDRRGKNTLRSYRLGFTKTRKIKRCIELLTAAKIKYYSYVEKTGTKATRFVISDRECPSWLRGAKHFDSWLFTHDPSVFINELKYWDGGVDKRCSGSGTEYSTCSLNNAEWVQTMAHLAGTTASISTKENQLIHPNWNRVYRVFVQGHKYGGRSGLRTGWNFAIERFNGKVFCAETGSGYFLVRYKGTVQVTGNSGRDLQPHNFPRGKIKDQEKAWEVINKRDLELLEMLYEPMEFLSHALRGAIWAPPGRRLMCGDYNAIETRVLFWLADEQIGLKVFREAVEEIYCNQASYIYRREITKKNTKERQFGKQTILGLGFGMGFVKFLVTCRGYDIRFTKEQVADIVPASIRVQLEDWIWSEAWGRVKQMIPDATREDLHELVLMKYVTGQYRSRYRNVVKLWDYCQRATILAIQNPGKAFKAGKKLHFYVKGNFLNCRLPSGRPIRYPFPKYDGHDVTYMGVDSVTHQWVRMKTYGGHLAQNATQGCARDFMAEGMTRCETTAEYNELVLTVHDEVGCEADEGVGTLNDFLRLLEQCPEWCLDLPMKAEGFEGRRYRKA